MSYGIKLVHCESRFPVDGFAEPGQWVADYNPDAKEGRGLVISTRYAAKAKRFASASDAYVFVGQQSTIAPLRSDGKPNRPLTAWTVSIEALP